jgi:hypothetical protein
MSGSTHKRMVARRFGGPDVLSLDETVAEEQTGGHVRIRVLAAGVAFGSARSSNQRVEAARHRSGLPSVTFQLS